MEEKVDFKSCVFIAFDLDLTGNKLIDEMSNIGAYGMEEASRFKQYVIPHRNINVFAAKRYLLKTANVYEFRVLRDCITRRAVKTKTEIFALVDFLNFLESLDVKKNGICLMFFESSTLVPYILLEALRRYKLLERFNRTVKGFVDCYGFVKENCASSILNFTLRSLVKILLNREKEKFHDAHERSRLIFEVVTHLCEGKTQNKAQDLAQGVCPFVKTVDKVEMELNNLKEFLQKQYALRPIFESQFKVFSLRLRALELRKLLITTDISYETLKASFEAKNDTSEVLKAKLVEAATENDITELVKIINGHFEKGPGETKEVKISRNRKDSSKGKPRPSLTQESTDEAPKAEKTEEATLPEPQTEIKDVTNDQKPTEVKSEPSPKSDKISKSEVSPQKKSDSLGKTRKSDASSKPKTDSSPKPPPTKSAEAKPKSAEAKQKSADVKTKSADPKPKTAESKTAEVKTSEPKAKTAEPKTAETIASEPKPKSADPKAKTAVGKPKTAEGKPKTADGKPKTAEGKPKTAEGKPKTADSNKADPKQQPGDSKGKSKPDKTKSSDSPKTPQNEPMPEAETSAPVENTPPEPVKGEPEVKQKNPKEKLTQKPKNSKGSKSTKKVSQSTPNGEPSATLPPAPAPTSTQAVV